MPLLLHSMQDTIALWIDSLDAIQHTYFRVGKYTHLYAEEVGGGVIKWTFTFMDFGMHHTITSASAVNTVSSSIIYVDGEQHDSIDNARDAVFGGRYEPFMREMYDGLGIDTGGWIID